MDNDSPDMLSNWTNSIVLFFWEHFLWEHFLCLCCFYFSTIYV